MQHRRLLRTLLRTIPARLLVGAGLVLALVTLLDHPPRPDMPAHALDAYIRSQHMRLIWAIGAVLLGFSWAFGTVLVPTSLPRRRGRSCPVCSEPVLPHCPNCGWHRVRPESRRDAPGGASTYNLRSRRSTLLR